jgi:hypothetical protein
MRQHILIHNKYLIVLIFLLFINLSLSGCYSSIEITPDSDNSDKPVKIYKIETRNGEIINYSNTKLGYAFIADSSVISIKSNGEKEVFPLSNVKKYYTEEYDGLKTGGLILGSVLLLLVIIVIVTISNKDYGIDIGPLH